jgi:cytochrome c biogenesis protein CcmG/thiol:disulfide interchange protein DsbE
MNTPSSALPRRRPRYGLYVSLALALALLLLLAVGMTRDPRELPSTRIGKPWPDMALPQLGDSNSLIGPAQLRGKARLINVWASWCAVCVDEQPVLLKLAKTLREQGRADQFISLNYKDRSTDAVAWLRRYGNPFATTLVDADGRMGIELGVYGAPETFLIDAQGTIVWKQVGEIQPEMLEREILPRLGARS